MIYLTGITVTFFLAILLAGEKHKGASHHILTAWLVVIGMHLSAYYAFVSGAYRSFPYYLGWEMALPLLHGPFLYWYTSSLTDPPGARVRPWWHLLPFLACYALIFDFLLKPAASRLATYDDQGRGYEGVIAIRNAAIMLSGVVYVVLSLVKLRRYRRFIENRFSDTDRINLAWLRYLIFGLSLIWIAVIISHEPLVFGLSTLFVIFIGYFGIKQVGILDRKPVYPEPPAPVEVPAAPIPAAVSDDLEAAGESAKYEKSGLKDEQVAALHQALTRLVEEQESYKDPELALADLAAQLDIHPNYLSQVINSVERKNFYDYINTHRIEEFKRLVAQPENQRFTLLALAFECGFSSKTSFNRNFKKVTGLTPSAYLERQHIRLESEADVS
jgi:AraC-like DNA-binding protein